MFLKEPELVTSFESQDFTSDSRTVHIAIYRLEDEAEWALAIDDEFGNTTIHNDTFRKATNALETAKNLILDEGINTFIGPTDGEGW